MADQGQEKIAVLFCCLGNICRSPLAEAVFADLVKKAGISNKFVIDSCGTGAYHAGDPPDERTVAVCRQNGVPVTGSARKVRSSDFEKFDWIFGMDANNVRNLKSMQPAGSKAKVLLFGDFDDKKSIADPYYGADNGFQKSYEQCLRYAKAFLKHLNLEGTRL